MGAGERECVICRCGSTLLSSSSDEVESWSSDVMVRSGMSSSDAVLSAVAVAVGCTLVVRVGRRDAAVVRAERRGPAAAGGA